MKSRLGGIISLAFWITFITGCGGAYSVVKSDSIHFPRYGYTVEFAGPSPHLVLGSGWVLDNFHKNSDGEWVMNTGSRYYGKAAMDRDGDGNFTDENVYFFDLKLNNSASNAVMWIQTHELSDKASGVTLSVLLRNYTNSLTGTGFYAEANVFSILKVKLKRFVAVIREASATRLEPFYALRAKIQVLNIDQKRVQPKHQGSMIQVTLLKLKYRYKSSSGNTRDGIAVMIIGYINRAEDFEKHLPDYRRLLTQLTFTQHK